MPRIRLPFDAAFPLLNGRSTRPQIRKSLNLLIRRHDNLIARVDLLRPMRVGTAGEPDREVVRIFRSNTRRSAAKLDILGAPPEDVLVALSVLHVLVALVDEHDATALRLGELNRRHGFHKLEPLQVHNVQAFEICKM